MYQQNTSTRTYAAYVLNLVSAFAVVMLHTSLSVFGPLADTHWHLDVLLQSVCIFAVPVFFGVSGMNLLNYRDRCDTKNFFIRRFGRAGVALLFGSALCYIIYGLFPSAFYGTSSEPMSFIGFIKGLLTNNINSTYWFFYTLFYLYLLTPIFSLLTAHKRVLQYILGLTAIAAAILPCLSQLGFPAKYFSTVFGWPAFAEIAVFYYIGGFYLKRYVKAPSHTILYAVGFALSFLTMYGLTCAANFPLSETYNNFWAGISSPFCIVEVFCLFQFVRSLEPYLQTMPASVKKGLAFISRGALGVYLIQMLFINYLGITMTNPVIKGLDVYSVTLLVSLIFIGIKDVVKHLWHGLG